MIGIIDYNAGNITSVINALNRLGVESMLSDKPEDLVKADRLILPGVGHAQPAMQSLHEKKLDALLCDYQKPVLGICLGLQLLCSYSEEGNTTCLGIFKTEVKRFPDTGIVPHMGWNNLQTMNSPLFSGLDIKSNDVYFVHGYYASCCQETIARCNYLVDFSAALQRDNYYAVQFHPEKSAEVGEQILKNFLHL